MFKSMFVAGLAVCATALPSVPKLDERQISHYDIVKRQNEAAMELGLGDPDILNFALTLEFLEAEFYKEAIKTFPDAASMGVDERVFKDIVQIGKTEATHASLLMGALAQAGAKPVQRCEYDFSAALGDPQTLLATAGILENVGVSAYLGAAPLVQDAAILSVAGSILTIEARHQSSIRVFTEAEAIPSAFDVPLGLRSVFSLAAPFISECPDGSNLVVEAFPELTMPEGQEEPEALAKKGGKLQLESEAAGDATHCAFTAGGASAGGTVFSPYKQGEGCIIPKTVAGIAYVSLVNDAPVEGILTDTIVVAGPMAVSVS